MVKTEKKKRVNVSRKAVVKKKGKALQEVKDPPPLTEILDGWPVATERPCAPEEDSSLFLMKVGSKNESDDDNDDFCFGNDDDGDDSEEQDAATKKSRSRGDGATAGVSAYDAEPALPPGPCLKACSGTDVQLARGANYRPNLQKGKGRFLIVMPGLMSFQQPNKEQKSASIAMTQESTFTQETSLTQESIVTGLAMTQDTIDIDNDDDDDDNSNNFKENDDGVLKSLSPEEDNSKVVAVAIKPTVPKLGKIEKLGTANPVLKIPFGDGRILAFSGKQIESSSKFMMMTCKSNKQSVTCKDIFSSIIVFGDGKWQSEDSDSPMTIMEPLPTQASDDETDDAVVLNHYGGSERTVDGGKAARVTSKSKQRVVAVKRQSGVGLQEVPPKLKLVSAKKEEPVLEIDEDSYSEEEDLVLDDSDEDEYVAAVDVKQTLTRTKTPKRSAGKAKLNYADLLVDSDDQEETSGENKREGSADEDSVPPMATAAAKNRATRKRKDKKEEEKVVDIDIDEQSEQCSQNDVTSKKKVTPKSKPAATRKTPPRTGTRKRKEPNDDKVVEIVVDDDVVLATDSGQKKTRKRTPRRSVAKTSIDFADSVADSDNEVRHSKDDEDGVSTSEDSAPQKAIPARNVAARKSSATPTKRVADSQVLTVEESDDSVGNDNGSNRTRNVTRKSNPRRRASNSKVSYSHDSEDSEEGSDKEDLDEEKGSVTKKRATSRKRQTDRNEAGANAAKESEGIILPTKKAKTVKPASKKSTIEIVDIESDDGEASRKQAPPKKAKPSRKKSVGTRAPTDDKSSSPKNSQLKKGNSTRRTRVGGDATSKIAVNMVKKAVKPLVAKNETIAFEDEDEPESEAVNTVSKSPSKLRSPPSSFESPRTKHSRRKRKSPVKSLKSPSTKKLALTVNDDEFSFLE